MKYKWKVEESPTGRYRSFERRGFPHAYYENEDAAAYIASDTEYEEYIPKKKEYTSLVLRVADYSLDPTWKWRKIVKRYKTIQEAKDGFDRFVKQHPEIVPKEVNTPIFMKI